MTYRKPHCNIAISIEHVPREQRVDCITWCFEAFGKENVDPWPSNSIDIKRTNGNDCIYLARESDATMFKLKWR